MQIVFLGDKLHEMSSLIFWENKKNIVKCPLLTFLSSVLPIKHATLHVLSYLHVQTVMGNLVLCHK